MNQQMVLAPEASVEVPRYARGNFLARLVRAALLESEARRSRQASARSPEGNLESALWQVEREQRLAELRRQVSIALVGFMPNPFDPNGR